MGIARKLAQLIVTVILVTLFSSLLLELLPGDPVEVLVPFGSDEQRASVREELNLDQPFIARYGSWLGNFVQGDMGNYYTVSSKRPVAPRIMDALPISLLLMLYAQILAIVIAIPAGGDRGLSQRHLVRPNVEHHRVRHAGDTRRSRSASCSQYYLAVQLGWFSSSGLRAASASPSPDTSSPWCCRPSRWPSASSPSTMRLLAAT